MPLIISRRRGQEYVIDEFSDLPISEKAKTQRRYQRDHYDRVRQARIEYSRNNPEKIIAQNTVNNLIRAGIIIREKCEQCDKLGDAHHEDYSQPLKIRWLCHKHHLRGHLKKGLKKDAKS